MNGYIDIKKLTLDELMGIVNLYPWFGGARKELCARMASMGGDALSEEQFASAAMYLPSRRILADMLRGSAGATLTDDDVEDIIKSYVAEKKEEKTEEVKAEEEAPAKKTTKKTTKKVEEETKEAA